MAACFPPACIKAKFFPGNGKNMASKSPTGQLRHRGTGTSDYTHAFKNRSEVEIKIQFIKCRRAWIGADFSYLCR